MQKPGASILCYLALTACASSLFWTLMIASGHVGAGNGSYVAGLMWCPAFAAVATVYLRRLDFKMLGLRWAGLAMQFSPIAHRWPTQRSPMR